MYVFGHAGAPIRIRAITDHRTPVLDLLFSPDNVYLYTASEDGSVHRYRIQDSPLTRDREYIGKAHVIDVSLALSPSNDLVASFVMDSTLLHDDRRTESRGIASRQKSLHPKSRMNSVHDTSSILTESVILAPTAYIAIWEGGMLSQSPTIIHSEVTITSICFGRKPGHDLVRDPFVVLGYSDGRIAVSAYPLPILTKAPELEQAGSHHATINPQGSITTSTHHSIATTSLHHEPLVPSSLTYIDSSNLTLFHYHCSSITSLRVSDSGLWIFAASLDKSITMYSTTYKPPSESVSPTEAVPEHGLVENTLVLVDREQLKGYRAQIADTEYMLLVKTQNCDGQLLHLNKVMKDSIAELKHAHEQQLIQLQADHQLERDAAKVESQRIKEGHQKKDADSKTLFNQMLTHYEAKLDDRDELLAQSRQAYDELTAHMRLNYEDRLEQANMRESNLLETTAKALDEVQVHSGVIKSLQQAKEADDAQINSIFSARKDEERYGTTVLYVPVYVGYRILYNIYAILYTYYASYAFTVLLLTYTILLFIVSSGKHSTIVLYNQPRLRKSCY